jgi:hypothetical protein
MYVYVCMLFASLVGCREIGKKPNRKRDGPHSMHACVCIYWRYMYVCICMHVRMYVVCKSWRLSYR